MTNDFSRIYIMFTLRRTLVTHMLKEVRVIRTNVFKM